MFFLNGVFDYDCRICLIFFIRSDLFHQIAQKNITIFKKMFLFCYDYGQNIFCYLQNSRLCLFLFSFFSKKQSHGADFDMY